MYSKAFQESTIQGQGATEEDRYATLYMTKDKIENGGKKAQAAKEEVDQILVDAPETLRARYADVVDAIESVFGSVDEHDFKLDEIGDIIRERRSRLQLSYGKIAAESWNESTLIKGDLAIQQVVKKIKKIDGNTVRLFVDFHGDEYYTDFNLQFGQPNLDAINWTITTE